MGLSQTAWVLVAFILFFFLVGKKLWSTLTYSLDERKKIIENDLNEAKKLREEAQAELNASLKKQKEINEQVLDIINDAKKTANQIEANALKKSDIVIIFDSLWEKRFLNRTKKDKERLRQQF